MHDIDDSALLHARVYDPAKARAYYLRTRKLKGRPQGGDDDALGPYRPGTTPDSSVRPSRQKELKEQMDALEARFERLKSILSNLVDAAKARSGVDVSSESAKSGTTKTADKKTTDKAKPLTEKQKRDKREASAEQYEKEKKASLSVEVQQLQQQIKEIRAKIEDAIADARKKTSKRNGTLRQPENSDIQTAWNSR